MRDALTKVDTRLSERWMTTCVDCGYERQVFGTKDEARHRAEVMGWEFREKTTLFTPPIEAPPGIFTTGYTNEVAYCPHCALLTKEPP